MKTASRIFLVEDLEKVRQAVAFAENKTSGEIVPVAATASGRYDRAEDIFGFLFAIAGLCAAWLIFPQPAPSGDFGGGGHTLLPLPVVVVLLIVLFSLGVALATWFPALRLPFITREEMRTEVEFAAAAAFHNHKVHGSKARTGILIYISLYERMVRVIADEAIAGKVDQSQWDDVTRLVANGMAQNAPTEGLCAAIARCGEILSGPFPRPKDDVDELSNELRIID